MLSEPSAKGSGPASYVIVAYFYQADETTPLAPAPTDVKVTAWDSPSVPLTLQEQGGKSPGRFATAPGAYSGEVRGKLEAKAGGQPVTVNFFLR